MPSLSVCDHHLQQIPDNNQELRALGLSWQKRYPIRLSSQSSATQQLHLNSNAAAIHAIRVCKADVEPSKQTSQHDSHVLLTKAPGSPNS
jgi:hypothetical protein